MRQLNVFCEGPTEQGFCVQVLRPHLFPAGDGIVHTLAVGRKDHHHLYGIGRKTKYDRVRKFILNTIKQRQGKNVYFTSEVGNVYVLPASPNFSVTATNRLGDMCMATPAISSGTIFFRTRDKLIAVGK